MRLIIAIGLLLFADSAGAEADCAGGFSQAAQVLDCAQARSLDVQRATADLARARAEVGVAGQWKNPELSANSVTGRVNGESASETDVALGIPLELGGKIAARTEAAEGRVARAEATLLETQLRVRATVILRLHRLRQILHEREVVDETIKTFQSLVKAYGRRAKLSPEQELSVTVFRMAASDSILKRADLEGEFSGLENFFQVALGTGAGSLQKILPPSPSAWPVIRPGPLEELSPRLRFLKADLASARADQRIAQSESWPTLMLGPSLKIQSEAGHSDQRYGFNLSFPIPVFNANGAGRAAAAQGVHWAETNQDLGRQSEAADRADWRRVYEQSVQALRETLSHPAIEKEHADVERLFARGLVPSALVIESHRTFVDLEKSRDQRELKALEAFYGVLILDGKTPELFK